MGALDNIAHNTSSTTSVSSFHGTGISIFQFPTESVPGEIRPPLVVRLPGTEHQGLPESYTMVPTVALNTSSVSFFCTSLQPNTSSKRSERWEAKQQESRWVNHTLSELSNDDVSAEDSITWAAYHSKNQQQMNDPTAITAFLPLFYEKADTPAMINHGMDVLRGATSFLNPVAISRIFKNRGWNVNSIVFVSI